MMLKVCLLTLKVFYLLILIKGVFTHVVEIVVIYIKLNRDNEMHSHKFAEFTS